MTAPRPTGTSVDPPRGCGPAWERPGARSDSYLHPHVDAPHFGVGHHLARLALGELAAEVDHVESIGEGQQRVYHMLDPDHRHPARLDAFQLIDELLRLMLGQS